MKKGSGQGFGLHWQSLLTIFFKALYFLINFFILVGELTRRIIVAPFLVVFRFYSSIRSLSLPKVTLPSYTIPKLTLPKFSLPKFKIPSFTFPSLRLHSIGNRWKRLIEPFRSMSKFVITLPLPRLPRWPKVSLPKITRVQKIQKPKAKTGVFTYLMLKFKYFLLGSIVTLSFVFIYQSYLFVKALPSPENIGKINYALSTHIFDRNGKLLYEIYKDQNRTPIQISEIPDYVKEATIAIEDKDFYNHKGIAIISGVLRAVRETVLKGDLQGGSTITQQLVKTALLSPERTIQRKVKEIILALWAEQLFTKDEILEMYLNQVPYGGSAYGVEEAAKTYFGKSVKDLTLSEAALLAGLPQAPSIYSPYINPKLALQRRNEVLLQMRELEFITEGTMKNARKDNLNIIPLKTKLVAPHFVFYVKSELEDQYGVKQVEEGGLKVTTTLDLTIQEEAEKILQEELARVKSLNITNGAILITRPHTGEILAMVGSVDYFNPPYGAFNVTTALRQPGSSIKPLMYSLALQQNYTAATIIDDSPTTFASPGTTPYRPVNYDGRTHGRVPLRLALANSYNIPAVKVLNTLGVQNFVQHAQKMGISTWNDPSRFGLSLTLGGGEVRMVDMARAFGVFANQGNKIDLSYILKLQNAHGDMISELSPNRMSVLNEGVSYIISDILSDNFARQLAFGARSALEIPGYKVAVKTGTTDEMKDNWTIGYTPEFLVAVWVGNNDNTPMNRALVSGITGAAPIWNRTMTYLLKNYGNSAVWYPKPDNIVEKPCYYGRTEYFISGTEQLTSCREQLFKPTPTPQKN
ncbi:hypothetical protein A2866_01090 [Candidatus Roizmanbacteria bacterium RIFCSPHIGHO2_01_FULL_39_8]|uniref:Uncharacterized protein n=2 Tax=Candidatus Roizmaniibacteriota TaxID=1752723 RepID=A0A1F7GMQ5_9BACT|nr:MAG: hypothetical protein A2866_01090 [Candidatus Roizmanbacteria bacterium RIFCSPHIGHO2_01_FULL_39_8]OGK25531.1 MAG: hypothetical protein A3C28_01585 [Candidatus Roizmanbacteria bacterium RIFCSPHIGHO2_02_FULL_39_9]